MLSYNKKQIKKFERMSEEDLLAIIAVDEDTYDYEVVYTDEAYRDFCTGIVRKDFFSKWRNEGLTCITPSDRQYMEEEISADHISMELTDKDIYVTGCVMDSGTGPFHASATVRKDFTMILTTFGTSKKS